jgi:hypothetical protein
VAVRLALLVVVVCPTAVAADPSLRWWADDVDRALAKAKENRPELEKALASAPTGQRAGMAFLVANMPSSDLTSLKADYLLDNCRLAYRARAEMPWGKAVPEDLFLNDVLPYANVDERRDDWRREFYDLCRPIVANCKTASEAVQKLNVEVFRKLNVKYSTKRRAPNQGPKESIATGTASCTGMAIVLCDACRSVGIPARVVGTPLWANKRGNHTWVEVWDNGWHFTGACEPDPNGLNRGWFVGDAARAVKDLPEHAIYAASFKRTGQYFPLVWARSNRSVPAENVTDRYAKPAAPADTVRVLVRVRDGEGKRIATTVTVAPVGKPAARLNGMSRDERADANDFLTFHLTPSEEYEVRVPGVVKRFTTTPGGREQVIDVVLPEK